MSRKIKFRAWVNDHWTDFIPVAKTLGIYSESVIDVDGYTYEKENPFIVEQYTGLKDKTGKEIYEGDIVKNIEGVNETAVCVWDESNAEFDFRGKDGKYTRDNVKSWLEMYEVIGNIHENPELLGGEE